MEAEEILGRYDYHGVENGIESTISQEEESVLFEGPVVGALECAVSERPRGLLDTHNRLRAAGRPRKFWGGMTTTG